MEGHAYARRLSEDEFKVVAELTRMNVKPRDILTTIKQQNSSNVSILKNIYNARDKIRMDEQGDGTQMQVLMSLLDSEHYVYQFTTSGSNELENLFFIHPTSHDIWRAFPHVLLIDATYKTNLYNMPFVQIVGVTSTNKTFCIAFAFMHNEQTDNYRWVLNCLKSTLDECMLPRVIVTDREMALLNACKEVFPDAAQLLCRWHIHQNLMKRCRKTFPTKDQWDYFLSLWMLLENSPTMSAYTKNYQQLHLFLSNYPRVSNYVNKNWLKEYKEMFVSLWIDRHMNFGNTTTNRVESQHAKLKKYLVGPNSSLPRFVRSIDEIGQSQHTAIKGSLESSKVFRIHQHNLQLFTQLRGFVSNDALKLLIAEYERLKNPRLDCCCRLRTSCGLPCACEISKYISSCEYIPLDSIDIFWRTLDISPPTTSYEDVSCDNVIQEFKEKFNNLATTKKKGWIKKLKTFLNPSTTDIQEPHVQTNTRGRTSLKKLQSQKQRPADPVPHRFSCTTELKEPMIKERARHSSYEIDLNKRLVIDLNEVPDEFGGSHTMDLSDIPTIFRPYVANIQDVLGDGNCGYRAAAVSLGWNEHDYDFVRVQMLEELLNNWRYRDMFQDDFDDLCRSTKFSESPRPYQHWMKMPHAGILIANRFGVIVQVLSGSSSTTIFPFWRGPEEIQPHRTVTIAHVNDASHFVMVELQGEYPMPGITPYWHPRHINPSAAGWQTMYKYRIDQYYYYHRRRDNVVVDQG